MITMIFLMIPRRTVRAHEKIKVPNLLLHAAEEAEFGHQPDTIRTNPDCGR